MMQRLQKFWEINNSASVDTPSSVCLILYILRKPISFIALSFIQK